MPLKTFFHLPEEKRNRIISAAIHEFSTADYNTASINQICKEANIAKGSFYQYFTDKLDLYVYMMTLAIEAKIQFFSAVLADFHPLPLRDQFRLLFMKSIEFAQEHPHFAALGEQFSKERDETVKSAVIKEGDKRSESLFMQMIQDAKSKHEIDPDIHPLALSMLLQSLLNAVHQYRNDKFGQANYEQNEEDLSNFLDSLLKIIFNGVMKRTSS